MKRLHPIKGHFAPRGADMETYEYTSVEQIQAGRIVSFDPETRRVGFADGDSQTVSWVLIKWYGAPKIGDYYYNGTIFKKDDFEKKYKLVTKDESKPPHISFESPNFEAYMQWAKGDTSSTSDTPQKSITNYLPFNWDENLIRNQVDPSFIVPMGKRVMFYSQLVGDRQLLPDHRSFEPYFDCGLRNVFLRNCFKTENDITTVVAESKIRKIITIHIFDHIDSITGKELRHIRTEFGLTKAYFGKLIGIPDVKLYDELEDGVAHDYSILLTNGIWDAFSTYINKPVHYTTTTLSKIVAKTEHTLYITYCGDKE